MDKSLQKRLKSEERSERFTAINELANLATDEAISTLKRVLEGKRRAWLSRYDFDDQIQALKALADLPREDVRDYLRHYFHEDVKYESSGQTSNTFMNIPTWDHHKHTFPYACGELAKRLMYNTEGQSGSISRHLGVPADQVPPESVARDEEAHRVRESILNKINE